MDAKEARELTADARQNTPDLAALPLTKIYDEIKKSAKEGNEMVILPVPVAHPDVLRYICQTLIDQGYGVRTSGINYDMRSLSFMLLIDWWPKEEKDDESD